MTNRIKPLLVGESNPHGGDPRVALYPRPPGCAGHRLMRILGMDEREYLRSFDRVNLLGPAASERWHASKARLAAVGLVGAWGDGQPLVLLGARVAAAFRLDSRPFSYYVVEPSFLSVESHRLPRSVLVLPHPSGRSRAWNDPGAADRARGMVLALVGRE